MIKTIGRLGIVLMALAVAGPPSFEAGNAQEAQPAVAPELAGAIRAAEQRLARAPGDPALMFELGSLRARAGDRTGALALLEQVVASKAGLDPEGSGFDRLKGDGAYRALLERIRKEFPPVSTSTPVFTIQERDLIPEGIAYDPGSGRFFVGSIQKHKIVAIAQDGAVADFVPSSSDDLNFALGLRVDPARKLLWAACEFRVADGGGSPAARSGVAAYDLSSGRLARRVLIDGPGHLANDLVVTRSGDVYFTDTRSNGLYRLPAGGTRLEQVLDAARIERPNGIALSPDESRVFIAAWPSIVAMDLRTRNVVPLRHATAIVTGGIDGLYFHDGTLIGVQNDVHPGRILRYQLSPDLATVERVQVLEAYNPRFDIPTTAAIANGHLYYMANTQLSKAGERGQLLVPVNELKPIEILRLPLAAAAGTVRGPESLASTRALHRTLLTFDSHVDTPMRMPSFDIGQRHPVGMGMVDLPRMEDGGLWVAMFAVFRGQGELTDAARTEAVRFAGQKLDQIERQVLANPGTCRLARSADDIESAFRERRRAVVVGMENGYQIGLDLDNLDRFFARGVRVLTLTHDSANDIGDSATDRVHPDDRGLSEFGRRVIERMNRLGMVIDLAHSSDKTFFDTIQLSRAPVIVSHGAARALKGSARNVSDEQLGALRTNCGVIGIALGAGFLDRATVAEHERDVQAVSARIAAKGGFDKLGPAEAAAFQEELRHIKYRYPQAWGSVRDVVDHIDHVVRTIGIDHVGIGSDFDGGGYLGDCRDVSEYPNLTAELVRRGYSEADIRRIWAGNYLRVLRRVQEAAALSRQALAPSTVRAVSNCP